MSLASLTMICKIEENFCSTIRPVDLINMHTKEWYCPVTQLPFINVVYIRFKSHVTRQSSSWRYPIEPAGLLTRVCFNSWSKINKLQNHIDEKHPWKKVKLKNFEFHTGLEPATLNTPLWILQPLNTTLAHYCLFRNSVEVEYWLGATEFLYTWVSLRPALFILSF